MRKILTAFILIGLVGSLSSFGNLADPQRLGATLEAAPTADGAEVTARMTIRRCLPFVALAHRWAPDFPDLDPALVMSVAAQESACYQWADDGHSVGLMQVRATGWTHPDEKKLIQPALNVYWGEYILSHAIANQEHNPGHEVRRALAAYNCGWESVQADRCLPFGGFTYADRVLGFWLPRMQLAFREHCRGPGADKAHWIWACNEWGYGGRNGAWRIAYGHQVAE